jgi:hypothetical protein
VDGRRGRNGPEGDLRTTAIRPPFDHLGYTEKCGRNRQIARRRDQQYDAIIYKHACGRGIVSKRLGKPSLPL